MRAKNQVTGDYTSALINVGSNAKTVKSDKSNSVYKTAIMYLAPHTNVRGFNVCAMAERAGCAKACLFSAGRGAFSSVQSARIRKTELFRDEPVAFMHLLVNDIAKAAKKAEKNNYALAVRLNGTSDIFWENLPVVMDGVRYKNVFDAFPAVLFYDYTKNISAKRLWQIRSIANYSLTASYSEANRAYALRIAGQDAINIAVVFSPGEFDSLDFSGTYTLISGKRLPLINGDINDERYLDPTDQQYVVALRAKGQAKKETGGFVVQNAKKHNQTIARV